MKRYRILRFDFDTRAIVLGEKIQDTWEPRIKEMHQRNKDAILASLKASYGESHFEGKVFNFIELGPSPFSILAFHNDFLLQAKVAFVSGAYYPALTGVCALGERILNHLVLILKDDFRTSKEYKMVYRKDSFDNWDIPIDTLEAWNILSPASANHFRRLKESRNNSIHFRPDLDKEVRTPALEAIHTMFKIIEDQFPIFGIQPWFIAKTPGASYIKKEAESWPFINKVYLPNCSLVGPFHRLGGDGINFVPIDDHPYDDKEISDEEFAHLLASGKP